MPMGMVCQGTVTAGLAGATLGGSTGTAGVSTGGLHGKGGSPLDPATDDGGGEGSLTVIVPVDPSFSSQ